jgi:hypothetical protein
MAPCYSKPELRAARELEAGAQARLDDIHGRLESAVGAEAMALGREAHAAHRDLGRAHFVLSDSEMHRGGRA